MRAWARYLMYGCLLCVPAWNAEGSDKCLACHELLGDKASLQFKRDVHRAKGITCAGCHGGDAATEDMERAMGKESGFVGVPKGNAVSEMCAKCHSDPKRMTVFQSGLPVNQLEKVRASVHGGRLIAGQGWITECTTCHEAHGIRSVKDQGSPVHPLNVVKTCSKCHNSASLIRSYNPSLPVDQLEKYRTSVHGERNAKGDSRVAECASCHGGHDILRASDVRSKVYKTNIPSTCAGCHSDVTYMKGYSIPTTQFEEFSKSVHGVALLEKNDPGAPACNDCHGNHGATPPGVESISRVCGTCHALNAELFSASPHKKAFDERGLPECETCHGSHEIIAATDQLLGASPEAVCSRCHSDSQWQKGYLVASMMRSQVDSLVHSEELASRLVDEAEQKGMEVGDAKFRLRDIRQARYETRTAVHSFDEVKFSEVIEKGLRTATVAAEEALTAIDEYYFRRIGLGVSTLIITILAVSLYLFIRRIEQ